MKSPEQWAKEAWAYISFGNIAVPANADVAGKAWTPFFRRAMREAVEKYISQQEEINNRIMNRTLKDLGTNGE